LYTDAAQQQQSGSVQQVVQATLSVINLAGRPPVVSVQQQPIQTSDLNFISYFVPSMLGLSVMQAGLFSAIPLVADREKGILKRLAATPLKRWQLVGSNILMRLIMALLQAVIIVGVGVAVFGVRVTGNVFLIGGFIALGSLTFLALGYVIASFARTEDSANGMVSALQFPMMFLSGTFFLIDQMPDVLQGVARAIPLTYLSDGLRQVMVDGAATSPLWVCAAVLVAWLVACFAVAARFFRWQ
jgi:ABC-2 type transport system permease protein